MGHEDAEGGRFIARGNEQDHCCVNAARRGVEQSALIGGGSLRALRFEHLVTAGFGSEVRLLWPEKEEAEELKVAIVCANAELAVVGFGRDLVDMKVALVEGEAAGVIGQGKRDRSGCDLSGAGRREE